MKAFLLGATALVSALGLGAAANAAPITYTVTGTFDVNVNGSDFNNQNLTFVGQADTDTNILLEPGVYSNPLTSLTVSGSAFGTFSYTDVFEFFSNNNTQIVGFFDDTTANDIVDLGNAAFGTYKGDASFAEQSVVYPSDFLPGGTSNTPFGPAHITGARDVTFSADTTAAAVPEPASWALMLGGFGFAGAAMRRARRTTVRYA